ncbi:hypothetical protein NUACC21_58920 [Scytonema sp. NUACC21]
MLKIDRLFVQDIVSNSDSVAVTDAIIPLAKSLQLNITAERIETPEQLDYLFQSIHKYPIAQVGSSRSGNE